MQRDDLVPFHEPELAEPSRRFAARLFARLAHLRARASMVRSGSDDGYDFYLELPSPTGHRDRDAAVWMEEGTEPSVGFGEWHTHSSVWVVESGHDDEWTAIIDLIAAITSDEFVLTSDVGGEFSGAWGVLDLRDEDALSDQLTDKYSPGRVRIRSWSGSSDREVGVEDLSAD